MITFAGFTGSRKTNIDSSASPTIVPLGRLTVSYLLNNQKRRLFKSVRHVAIFGFFLISIKYLVACLTLLSANPLARILNKSALRP